MLSRNDDEFLNAAITLLNRICRSSAGSREWSGDQAGGGNRYDSLFVQLLLIGFECAEKT